jgi:hypothetical protein
MRRMKREICIECIELEHCRVRATLPHPILECELFKKADRADEFKNNKHNAIRGEGLCATCGLRDACTRRQVEGGVWHCEDYV